MDLRSKRYQLCVPWRDQFLEGIQTNLAFRCLFEKPLFLFDDLVIVGDRLRVRWMQRGHAPIEKVASRFRTTSHNLESTIGKPHRLQLREISGRRLALTIDERLPRVAM